MVDLPAQMIKTKTPERAKGQKDEIQMTYADHVLFHIKSSEEI